MKNIRELFHKIGNWHNKISVGTGVVKAELKQKFRNSSVTPEIEKILTRLSKLEQHTIEASRILNQLKDIVYRIIDPDTCKPKEQRRR